MKDKTLNSLNNENHSDECKIIILGNGRCYHTCSWLKNIILNVGCDKVTFISDRSGGPLNDIINRFPNLVFKNLLMIDEIIPSGFSKFVNIYRNIVTFLLLPIQAVKLRKILHSSDYYVVHSHCMYYALIAYTAGIKSWVTPQGSEILVRPKRSKVYRLISKIVFSYHKKITVDSVIMQEQCQYLYRQTPIIIQNGIDVSSINKSREKNYRRCRIVSLRAFTKLYQLHEIIDARNYSNEKNIIDFIYPFHDHNYLSSLSEKLSNDRLLGSLEKGSLYSLLNETIMAISIPSSDSSPRTVYEAIFCGAAVAVTNLKWVQILPNDMKSRIIVIDLKNPNWFHEALHVSKRIIKKEFHPSEDSLRIFDEYRTAKKLIEHY